MKQQLKLDHSFRALNNFFISQGGGGYDGAGYSRSLRNWSYTSGLADSEILGDLATLRERARDLYRNNAIARGAIGTVALNVIGSGLFLQSNIDRDFLNITDNTADLWETNVERKFFNWATSKDSDASRSSTFFDNQNLAFLAYLMSGESFTLLPIIDRGSGPQLCIQVLEADLIQNKPGQFTGEKCRDGITVDEYGAPKEYSVRTGPSTWKTVKAYGDLTGRVNVIHLFKKERPGQTRGVPFLSSVIEELKDLGRYNKSELAAAVISSMYTVFVKSMNPHALDDNFPLSDSVDSSAAAKRNAESAYNDYTLGPGAVHRLEDDEDITFANPTRPNTAFEAFINAKLRQIGMALQIPYEILAKQFLASYSASRASRIEAWRFFLAERRKFTHDWCQVIYEEWLTEEILHNRIPAHTFFNSVDYRKAWSLAEWNGETMGQIDEEKEVNASILKVQNGFSTRQKETAALGGGDFQRNVRKGRREQQMLNEAGIAPAVSVAAKPQIQVGEV